MTSVSLCERGQQRQQARRQKLLTRDASIIPLTRALMDVGRLLEDTPCGVLANVVAWSASATNRYKGQQRQQAQLPQRTRRLLGQPNIVAWSASMNNCEAGQQRQQAHPPQPPQRTQRILGTYRTRTSAASSSLDLLGTKRTSAASSRLDFRVSA